MTSSVKAQVDDTTRDALMGLSAGDLDLLAEGLEFREEWRRKSGLDERSFALARRAANDTNQVRLRCVEPRMHPRIRASGSGAETAENGHAW